MFLVIQTSFLGDVVLTTPLLESLAERGPVDVLTTPGGAGLLAGHPAVRDVIVYDKRGADRGTRGFARMVSRVRRREDGTERGAHTAYLAQGSARSAAIALAAGIPRRVGFNTSAGRALYTERVPYRHDRHHAERLWGLANSDAAGFPPESRAPSLAIPEEAVASVDALLAECGVMPGEPLVALAPGSMWGTKRWPGYAGLASILTAGPAAGVASGHVPDAHSGFASGSAMPVRLVLIGSRDEQPLAEEVEKAMSAAAVAMPSRAAPAPVNAAGRLTLPGSAELIRRCMALVSNDSLPQHLASAVGTPTVTIFGPTVPEFGFGPLAAGSVTVGVGGLDCRPCDRHGPQTCPLKHWRCMRDLRAEVVMKALSPLLFTEPDA